MIRLAHSAIRTPGACGLYETARELAEGLRGLGVDARIVDPQPNSKFAPAPSEDRGVPIADMEWARTADVVASHSGHDGTPLADSDQPIIQVVHGRPASTWLMEREGGAKAYTYATNRRHQDRYRAAVTFWPEYEPVLRSLWAPTPVYAIPPSVDTEYWAPGETDYDFGGKAGGYNVVLADPWSRRDVCPIHAVHAFALFRHIVPDARLHIYAVDQPTGFGAIRSLLGDSLGVVQGWASDLRSVYRAADMLITPHRIYTRSIREAMATGLQVVSGRDVHAEDAEAFAMAMAHRRDQPQPNRELAKVLFSREQTARAFRGVVEGVLNGD